MLGSALSPIAGEDIGQLTNFGIPVERLNVAFQGDIDYLPGLGPFVSIPLGLLMPDDWYGTLPDFVRSWAFPFGRPQLETGVIEATTLPSWARRFLGGLYRDDMRAYATKDVLEIGRAHV